MRSVKVVTAYVPLDVKHLSPEQYKEYGDRLAAAIPDNIRRYDDYPLSACWLYQWLLDHDFIDFPPATAVPSDRYETPRHMVNSNIVQHQRTSWMRMAMEEDPKVDVLVWLDYAILKQGAFTGKPVTEQHVADFVRRVGEAEFDDIPFPGIWPQQPISIDGDNWRFVGSTHIIPRQHLPLVDDFYRYECRKFIMEHQTIPLDLPIWAAVEQNTTLPFVQYPANHDATQLTNFPRGPYD